MACLYNFSMYQGILCKKQFKLSVTNAELGKRISSSLKNFSISNNEKLLNNIIRAKTMIFDYAMNNDFKYFVTCTINEHFFVNDLNGLIKKTTQIIRDLRKKYNLEFKYIFIPEKTEKGVWHLHGFFDDSFENDFYINDNLYLSWRSYDKIGFTSISFIDNYDACIRYMTKYIKKGFGLRKKGERLYFCSKNLKKSVCIDKFISSDDLNFIYYDCINDFSSKVLLTYDKFLDIYEKVSKISYLRL